MQGLALVAAVPALGEFQRLQKPSDVHRIPSGIEVLHGLKQIPTAPDFAAVPEAEPVIAQEVLPAVATQRVPLAVPEPAHEVGFERLFAHGTKLLIRLHTRTKQLFDPVAS